MSPDDLNRAAAEVLRRYPDSCHGDLLPLGNRGGFSGARLWRVGNRCLRAWPPDDAFPVRLDYIHHLLTEARDAGLTFVPRLERSTDLSSRVAHRGRWWELAEWLPGRADYRIQPTAARLEAACRALAQVHLVWGYNRVPFEACPAVERRLAGLRKWQELRENGWNPRLLVAVNDPLGPLVERAAAVLAHWLGSIPTCLTPWTTTHWQLQPCLCDVWHDHLLFEDNRLTGLIDYGSVKLDHVAVDLARLLGSLIEDDDSRWRLGLEAYRSVRPLSSEAADLARTLDRTGTVLAVANWLRWLYADGRVFEDRATVAERFGTLVTRIEGWGQPCSV